MDKLRLYTVFDADKIDGKITESFYNEKFNEFSTELKTVDKNISGHTTAVNLAQERRIRLYEIAQKGSEDFVDGDVDNGSLMSGQIAGLVNKEQSCLEIIEELFDGAKEIYGNTKSAESLEDRRGLGLNKSDSQSDSQSVEKDIKNKQEKSLKEMQNLDDERELNRRKWIEFEIQKKKEQEMQMDQLDLNRQNREINKQFWNTVDNTEPIKVDIPTTPSGGDAVPQQGIKVEESPEAKRNRENTNEMAERALERGSIFTHDIHIEKLFKKEIKQNDDLMKQQDELNEMIKADQMLDTDSRVMEAQGYVPRRDASGQTIRTPTGQALTEH
jgi:hypothetical protein